MARVLLCNKATSSAARVARHKLEGAIRDNTDALAKVLTQARYERSVVRSKVRNLQAIFDMDPGISWVIGG